ncbi:MAG: ACP S-malonyltransferase [Gammaproteobacteria bacterium]|nr:ACP S-malonyltransferase [Gammaproteobacteria bacterium]NNF61833.1 ACP S-malonyltransferase [Gammaproteobacteria bacterium]
MTTAFVFPGQGSQSLGMLADFAGVAEVDDTFAAAAEVLGYDLWEVTQHGPRERLDQTECTQPAMLTAGVALWRAWRARGGNLPQAMAGHSLGEYTALVCSGALDFSTAVGLVRFRGRAMQEAVPAGSGAMAAVLGLDDAAVEAACVAAASATEVVEAVNFNAPGQVVIAGHATAVERAIEAARASGARRAIRLPVSVPSHSSLMIPAAQRLREKLENIELKQPEIPSVYTVGLNKHTEPEQIRSNLVEQLHSPVRWADTIRKMAADDRVTHIIECGPGKVLSGLNRRIDRKLTSLGVFDRESLGAAVANVENEDG